MHAGTPETARASGLNDWVLKTRGFVVKFNLEGVDKFQASHDYACFAPVLKIASAGSERVRDERVVV